MEISRLNAELILCNRIYRLSDSLDFNEKRHLKAGLVDVHILTYLAYSHGMGL